MSVNVELKTPNQNNITWSLSLKANSRIPIVAERTYATLADAQTWVNDLADDATAYAGAIIAVVEDGKNNGIYFVQSIAQAATETTEFVPGVLVAAGAGAGSETVETFTVVDGKIAEAENIGQILYVTTGTVDYPSGPYIVTGVGTVAKLGTTTATGDIAGDVEILKGKVSTAEREIDTLQVTVGDANSGLVADVAGIKSTIGDAASGLVKDVADNAAEIVSLKGAVAGGVHFIGTTGQLPWEGLQSTTIGISPTGGASDDYEYNVGDIIIVASGGNEQGFSEPTKEYILAYGNETDPDGTITGYRWVELGDVTAEGQRISALEGLIDSTKVSTWNTAASQASTLTANIDNYALKTEVANDYVAKETGKSLVSDTLIAKLDGLANIKSVDANSVLSVNTDGALTANLSGYVAKDGNKVLSTNDFTNDLKTKLENVAAGAQVNVLEGVKINGTALTIATDKTVDINPYESLVGKVTVNGVAATAETDAEGSTTGIAVTVDAGDINLSANIGDHNAADTSVQSLLASVYETANSKLGSIYLAEDTTTANALELSKTNVANDTIALKIATGSAITATTNGLDLI